MKKNQSSYSGQKLLAYSAMAAAFAAGSDALKAEVVYVDMPDDTISIDEFYDLDLDANGSYDFHFQAGASTSGSWTFASVFGFRTDYSVGNASNQIIGYAGAYFNYASALNAGVEVGPKGNFLNYPSYSNSAVLASIYSSVTYGQFPGAGEKFIGIKFLIGTELHYGWVRLEADVDPAQIILKDYAYEMIVDHSIETGATVTIGIKPLEEGSITSYSYGSMIYLLNKSNITDAVVNVFDLAGNKVYTNTLTDALQIDMQAFASGNYMLQISSPAGNMTKQLFIE